MKLDRSQRYERADDYFELGPSSVLKLSSSAAREVCKRAAACGLWIGRVEGGIWRNPGFEARLDCIWDGGQQPNQATDFLSSNARAEQFIADETVCDTFVLTAFPHR